MRPALLAWLLIGAILPRATADVSVLASGAAQGALAALEPSVAGAGLRATFVFETSQTIARRLAAGDHPDVLIAQASAIDQAIKDQRAIADTRDTIGTIGIGVAVGPNGARPDVSTADALKAAVLRAELVVVSQGASGAHVERALAELGLAGQLTPKLVREPRGDDVMRRLAESRGPAIGFTMISEIMFGESHGGRYVGPLPAAMQASTQYDVIVMSNARDPEAARAFVRAITTPEARAVFARNGWAHASRAGDAAAERALKEIEGRLAGAWKSGDCDGWSALIAPEWSVIHVTGSTMTRAQALAACRAPAAPITTNAIDEVSVRLFGEAAVVTGRTVFATGGASPASVTLRFTDVFVRRAGAWQVVASHATRVGS